ncbi:MAG: hypothetical protein KY463_15830 [Actinobacteria bacterium]|nr:hypothetical protein [Actinomycetota bacterium]
MGYDHGGRHLRTTLRIHGLRRRLSEHEHPVDLDRVQRAQRGDAAFDLRQGELRGTRAAAADESRAVDAALPSSTPASSEAKLRLSMRYRAFLLEEREGTRLTVQQTHRHTDQPCPI